MGRLGRGSFERKQIGTPRRQRTFGIGVGDDLGSRCRRPPQKMLARRVKLKGDRDQGFGSFFNSAARIA